MVGTRALLTVAGLALSGCCSLPANSAYIKADDQLLADLNASRIAAARQNGADTAKRFADLLMKTIGDDWGPNMIGPSVCRLKCLGKKNLDLNVMVSEAADALEKAAEQASTELAADLILVRGELFLHTVGRRKIHLREYPARAEILRSLRINPTFRGLSDYLMLLCTGLGGAEDCSEWPPLIAPSGGFVRDPTYFMGAMAAEYHTVMDDWCSRIRPSLHIYQDFHYPLDDSRDERYRLAHEIVVFHDQCFQTFKDDNPNAYGTLRADEQRWYDTVDSRDRQHWAERAEYLEELRARAAAPGLGVHEDHRHNEHHE